MPGLILPRPLQRMLVVGPLYNQIDKLSRIEEIALQYDWIIFNSGICYPSDDIIQVKERINKMREFINKYKAAYLVGRTDYLLLTKTQDEAIKKWINGSYNIILADFSTRGVVITDGGIPETLSKRTDLLNNLEASFVSYLGDKSWHQNYNGRVGYVISNNPLTDKHPKYYSHSMQLGNFYNPNGAVYAVEVDEISLKKTILL